MKILVGTKKTQGQRSNDFSFTNAGEFLIQPVSVCTGEAPDDSCGCARSLVGVSTAKATTTALVVKTEIGRDQLLADIDAFYTKSWGTIAVSTRQIMALNDLCWNLTEAEYYPVGTVLEYRHGALAQRKIKDANAEAAQRWARSKVN